MNKPSLQRTIHYLNRLEMIYPCRNIPQREKQEKRSLQLLSQKDDYLSKYNRSIRHIFLIMLENGFDIYPDCVHPVFREICIRNVGISTQETNKIIKYRHRKKYYDSNVPDQTQTLLNKVLAKLGVKSKISTLFY